MARLNYGSKEKTKTRNNNKAVMPSLMLKTKVRKNFHKKTNSIISWIGYKKINQRE